MKFTIQRFSQYKLGNAPFKYDDWADSVFFSKEEAERYSNTADSGINGDTRYRYEIIEENPCSLEMRDYN